MRKIEPYETPYLNYVDGLASLATSTTIILGMFFLDSNNTENEKAVLSLFTFILIINCSFLLFWISKMLPLVIGIVKNKIELLKSISGSIRKKFS